MADNRMTMRRVQSRLFVDGVLQVNVEKLSWFKRIIKWIKNVTHN